MRKKVAVGMKLWYVVSSLHLMAVKMTDANLGGLRMSDDELWTRGLMEKTI